MFPRKSDLELVESDSKLVIKNKPHIKIIQLLEDQSRIYLSPRSDVSTSA